MLLKYLLTIFLTLALFFQSYSQGGIQFFFKFGLSDVGDEIWYETKGDLTGGLIIPVNSFWSLGGFYTQSLNGEYGIFNVNEETIDASMNEFGLISRYTVYRAGKFNFYLQNTLTYLTVDNTENSQAEINEFVQNTQGSIHDPVLGSESSLTFGVGAGINLRVSPKIVINLFQFNLKLVENNFMGIDDTFHKDFKIGITYQFQKGK